MTKSAKFLHLFLCFALLAPSFFAFETDQYNLSPVPLADIGDEVSEYTENEILQAIGKLNNEIRARLVCLENAEANAAKNAGKKDCGAANEEQRKLAFLRSEDAAALYVFRRLGAGFIPFTKSGTWLEKHRFKAQPARYKSSYGNSIYALVPTNYLTISPTIRIYAAEFGTDKIAHFFQQGYDYYKIYKSALKNGATPAEATQKAIRWGQMTERTYYGTLVSGVYSNADLCANFVGLKFYQGLTGEVRIGGQTRAAILRLENGLWTISEKINRRETLIKPFMTAHLNEALNPSLYLAGLRSFVRKTVRKNACPQWRARYPNLTQTDYAETTADLTNWLGEDYGFKTSRKFVTIAATCFDK